MEHEYDFIVIGSGFGGSVSALRLVEKGYKVLMLEKGRRFQPRDFPKTNWDLRRWLWIPPLGMRGLFQMTFFPHLTVVSGVGYGGGSLVYANTLPVPKDPFFEASSWAHLADWKSELREHYATAKRMLGVARNPNTTVLDDVIHSVAKDLGREKDYHLTDVGVFFGEPGKRVPDPFFGGEGPDRVGCTQCGACMLGCQVGAKNTLDKNYLYLAEKRGLEVRTEMEVTGVKPLEHGGYCVEGLEGLPPGKRARKSFTAANVVFSGGVLGTVKLLLQLKADSDGLPRLSDRLGDFVRTNSESLIQVVSNRRDADLSKGIAIGSILHTDDHSHIEPTRYPEGSGFWRLLSAPHVPGATVMTRLANLAGTLVRRPFAFLKAAMVPDLAKYSVILLYMRTLEGSIRMRLGRGLTTGFQMGLTTELGDGPAPTASIPEATELAHRISEKLDGFPESLVTETLMGVPTTAHILGGCTMGDSPETGVIDRDHRVFNYPGLYVVDGSAVSANPGVNPSLTITALAERAMSRIPAKSAKKSSSTGARA